MSLSAEIVNLTVRRQLWLREVKVPGLTSCLLVWPTCDRQENLALISSWGSHQLLVEHDIKSSGMQRGCLNPLLITSLLRSSHKELLFQRRQAAQER